MKPFVVNRHGRLVFPSNFLPELDFSVLRDLDALDAVIARDFEAKAPTGTDILERVESGQLRGALRPAARRRAEPRVGQPLRDDDVREAPDALARRAAPARRCVPARPHAVGGGRAQGRARSATPGTARSRRRPAGRGAHLPRSCSTSSPTAATTRRRSRRSSRRWPRSSRTRRTSPSACPATTRTSRPSATRRSATASEEVPALEALHRLAMVLHDQYPWDQEHTSLCPVGDLRDDDFVVLFAPRTPDVLDFIRRVKGGERPPARPAAPEEARRPARPYPPVRVAEQFTVDAEARGAERRQGRAPLLQRRPRPQRRLHLVADDRRRHRAQDRASRRACTPSAAWTRSRSRRPRPRSRRRAARPRRSAPSCSARARARR